jgi:hypothetical protein
MRAYLRGQGEQASIDLAILESSDVCQRDMRVSRKRQGRRWKVSRGSETKLCMAAPLVATKASTRRALWALGRDGSKQDTSHAYWAVRNVFNPNDNIYLPRPLDTLWMLGIIRPVRKPT